MVDFSKYITEKPETYARKCPECGTLYYPTPMICRNCSTRRDPSGIVYSAWEKIPLSGTRGKLLTWTRVYNLPAGYTQQYLLFGMADLENGLRVSGRLLVDAPKIGMKIIAKSGIVREKPGKDVYGLMFEAKS